MDLHVCLCICICVHNVHLYVHVNVCLCMYVCVCVYYAVEVNEETLICIGHTLAIHVYCSSFTK